MRKKSRKAGLDINCLPNDLLVEIIARVTSSSTTPVRDIISIKQSCKTLKEASKARKVGQRFSVDKEWMFHWRDKEGYFSLIRSCANSGNVQANYILGLELVFNRRDINAGLPYLKRAAVGGKHAAVYSIAVIYFRDPITRYYGIELFNVLCDISGNQRIARWRKETIFFLRKLSMQRWPLKQNFVCTNVSCGRIKNIRDIKEWWSEEEMERRFCSQLCRWTHEYKKFSEEI